MTIFYIKLYKIYNYTFLFLLLQDLYVYIFQKVVIESVLGLVVVLCEKYLDIDTNY